jgi:hypothetical protein
MGAIYKISSDSLSFLSFTRHGISFHFISSAYIPPGAEENLLFPLKSHIQHRPNPAAVVSFRKRKLNLR